MSKNGKETDSPALKRRQFIIQWLERFGEVTDATIEAEGKRSDRAPEERWTVSPQQLNEDAAYFLKTLHSHITRPKGEGKFVNRRIDSIWTYEMRKDEEKKEKQ